MIELSLDPFLSTDALETRFKTFSNTLKSAKIAGQVRRPDEVIKHFPDICVEKRQIRRRWQKYCNREDKIELNRLNQSYPRENKSFFQLKFDENVQRENESDSIWKLVN